MKKTNWVSILFAVIIFIGALSMLIPFVWMIFTTFKTSTEFYQPNWIPKKFILENYITLFTSDRLNFPLYFWNTVKVTVMTVIATILSCTLCSFALARINFPGKNIIFSCALISMFLPAVATMIPRFIIIKGLGLYNKHSALWGPAAVCAVNGAFSIFLLRQFFMSIPLELEEAAKIDGQGWLGMMMRIHIPLIIPSIITVSILAFQNTWGNIMNPLLYLQNEKLFTLALGIQRISSSQYLPQPQLQMTGYLVMLLPVVLIYVLCQKYFTESISATGLKG